MVSKQFANRLKRSALTVALGLCFVGGVQAQSAAGAIAGNATSGDTITITNPDTGFSRTVTVGADGGYRFSTLPIGKYVVTRNGSNPRNVTVNAGTASNVDFVVAGGAAALDTVTVVGTGVINPIDVSSVESTTVLTEEVLDRLPVGRNVSSVALLAPGTTRSDPFGGNAVSFGGASAAENAYYINGFNVTNIRSGLAYNEVPFEGIAETQVKTGGYGAEFGRSLGGVTNVITKRGSNEWKFSVGATWAPDELRAPTLHADWLANSPTSGPVGRNWVLTESKTTRDQLIYTAAAGGPIIKDRLFLYTLYQGDKNDADIYGTQDNRGTQNATRHQEQRSQNHQGLVKLDWNITDNHLIELTAFRDEVETEQTSYTLGTRWGTDDIAKVGTTTFVTGGDSYSLRWTGYLTDNFTLSALAGDGTYTNASIVPNQNCPFVLDHRDGRQHGCAVQASFGRDDNGDSRRAYRLDGEWVLGDHTLRFGFDQEEIHSIGKTVSSGGQTYDLYAVGDLEDLPQDIEDAMPAGTTHVVITREFSNGGEFDTTNSAWYLEDRWQITDNFLIYGGVRNESFENLNADGVVFAKADDTWAPRIGFSWDVNGDSTSKLFGNAGRYYIPIYTNTNVRLSGAELDIQRYYTSDGTFTGGQFDLPNQGTQFGTVVQSNGIANDPRGVVDTSLSPMFQDEYILGFQRQLSEKWAVGVRAIYRKLASGMDDYCAYQAPYNYALSQGLTRSAGDDGTDGIVTSEADAVGEAIGQCFLMNPGSDLNMNVDLDGAGPGGLTPFTIPASAIGLPEVKRTYKALEVFFERSWDDKWMVQGSYTWSKNFGNSEGYVNSEIAQADAGISADFDFAEFLENGTGYLPNDRRHTLKVFGAYKVTDEWTVGANVLIQSGRPKNCLGSYNGVIDPEDPLLYPGFSFFCDIDPGSDENGDGVPDQDGIPSPRGTYGRTAWQRNFGLQVAYNPNWSKGLRFSVDVFNVFNENTITAYRSRSLPPSQFQQPLQWQAPRSVRLGVNYDF